MQVIPIMYQMIFYLVNFLIFREISIYSKKGFTTLTEGLKE